jgi:hypothetical protein
MIGHEQQQGIKYLRGQGDRPFIPEEEAAGSIQAERAELIDVLRLGDHRVLEILSRKQDQNLHITGLEGRQDALPEFFQSSSANLKDYSAGVRLPWRLEDNRDAEVSSLTSRRGRERTTNRTRSRQMDNFRDPIRRRTPGGSTSGSGGNGKRDSMAANASRRQQSSRSRPDQVLGRRRARLPLDPARAEHGAGSAARRPPARISHDGFAERGHV